MICKSIILITGPTACGKTEVAINIARILGKAEVISVDSRQFYRFMDIGTAKPSNEDLEKVRHHFIDIANPDQQISAGEFGRRARLIIEGLWARGIVPVLVGGSGMYWKAVIDGFYEDDNRYLDIRKELQIQLYTDGPEALYRRLGELDPISQYRIDNNDLKRIMRALEVVLSEGKPLSAKWNEERAEPRWCQPIMIWLDRDRKHLYDRIDIRVESMIENGLLLEVENLVDMGYDERTYTMNSMGYIELLRYIGGQYSLEQAVGEMKKNSRRFAKRQTTWFRKDSRLRRLDMDKWSFDESLDRIIMQYHNFKGGAFTVDS